jgi:hypothetical protein
MSRAEEADGASVQTVDTDSKAHPSVFSMRPDLAVLREAPAIAARTAFIADKKSL